MAQKRDKFIKVMLTEEEYKNIERYSHIEFQNKSEFIREAIKTRIEQIKDQILFHKEDRMKDGNLRKKLLKETSEAIDANRSKELLQKPEKTQISQRKERLQERKRKLKKELEHIEQALDDEG
jgi:Arc/MetJ-type ribon-helix-helix transcriptional regulator